MDRRDVTSFGPAITRRTRTPITFGKIAEGQSGDYSAPALIPQLASLIPLFRNLGVGTGDIKVDPDSPDNTDLSSTIKHEEIHSLLNNLNFTGKMGRLASSNPFYKQVADKLTKAGRGGDPILETPAYAGAFEPTQTPVPQQTRNSYIGYLADQLQKMDPKIADKFKSLSGIQTQP